MGGLLLHLGVGKELLDRFGIGEPCLTERPAGRVGCRGDDGHAVAVGLDGGNGFPHESGLARAGFTMNPRHAVAGFKDVVQGVAQLGVKLGIRGRVAGGQGRTGRQSPTNPADKVFLLEQDFGNGDDGATVEGAVQKGWVGGKGLVQPFDGCLSDAKAQGGREEVAFVHDRLTVEAMLSGKGYGATVGLGVGCGGFDLGGGPERGREGLLLGVGKARKPEGPKLGQVLRRKVVAFRLAGERPQTRLGLRIGDAFVVGVLLDLSRAFGKLAYDRLRDAFNFEGVLRGSDSVAERFEVLGEAGVECRLIVRRIGFDLSHLDRLPAVFLGVESGIEDKDVRVQVRVGDAVEGAAGKMRKLGKGKIAGRAVVVTSLTADARFGFGLHVVHGVGDGLVVGVENAAVLRERVEDGDAFGGIESQIVADATVGLGADGERFAGPRVEVVTEGGEGWMRDFTAKAEPLGSLAAP